MPRIVIEHIIAKRTGIPRRHWCCVEHMPVQDYQAELLMHNIEGEVSNEGRSR